MVVFFDCLCYDPNAKVDMLTAEWDFDLEKEVARMEAREEMAKKFARFLLNDGKDVDYIARATGLDVNDVLHLQYQQ